MILAPVASVLPILHVLAALAAQSSAAVADANGCGELVQEMSRGKITSRMAYVALATLTVVMTWAVDIFAIVSFASRPIALYYVVQCALATRFGCLRGRGSARTLGFDMPAAMKIVAAALGAGGMSRHRGGLPCCRSHRGTMSDVCLPHVIVLRPAAALLSTLSRAHCRRPTR